MADKMREEFEQWAHREAVVKGYYYLAFLFTKHEDGSYKTTWVDSAWMGWKASRAVLIANLKELEWAPCVLQEAIDAAGVEPC